MQQNDVFARLGIFAFIPDHFVLPPDSWREGAPGEVSAGRISQCLLHLLQDGRVVGSLLIKFIFGGRNSEESLIAFFRLFSRRLLEAVTIESTARFPFSIERTAKCRCPGWKIGALPARGFERIEGKSRFRAFDWGGGYLRWYFHVFGATILRRRRVDH